MIYNRIPVIVGGLRKINLPPIMYQYDQVQKLILTDIDLPESYRVDFCNEGDTRTITMVGTADGVEIPNQLLQAGKPIKAFVVLSGVDANAVETRIDINIPVNKRPPASDIAPTPAQQTTIDTLIEAMNTAVEDAETAEQGAKDAQQAIEDMTVSAETLAPGSAATVTKTIIEDVVHLLFGIPRGDKGAKGDPGTPGATGNGIASITLISTSGLNKTYRITYTNGNHFDYVVTDGEKGDTGNGIYSIYKTGTSGKVDTYTILFTDGNTTDFTVTNGTDGTDGEDGVSPEVTITTITGGHRVTITDADHPTGQSFDVMDGQDGQNTDAEHVTYDSTQTYSSGTVGAGLNQLNSDITDLTNNKAPIITDTASGAIASFPDGADGLPIKQLTVAVNPVQDLHGYDNPWPAGGGKNLVDQPAILAVQATIAADGSYHVNLAASLANVIVFQNDGSNSQFSVTFISKNSGTSRGVYPYIKYTDNTTEELSVTGHTSYATVTKVSQGTKTVDYIALSYGSNVETWFYIQVEKGSTPTAWAPYSNICPISGWTGANVYDTGVNIWDGVWETGYIDTTTGLNKGSSYTRSKNYVPVKPNATYFSTKYFRCFFYKQDKSFIRFRNISSTEGIIEVPENCYFIRFCTTTSEGTVEGASINYPDTDTTYHAYSGQTLPITFPDSAGTVYGGTLTVNGDGSGTLTVDHIERVYTGANTEDWSVTTAGGLYRFQIYPAGIKNIDGISRPDVISNLFKPKVANEIGVIYHYSTRIWIFPPTSVTTVAELRTWLATNNLQVVYELATPIEYTLTAEEVGGILTTLKGENNVWADTGNVELEYRADTKLYLEKLTAPTEDDMVANANIASGKFFMIGNNLYLSTASIATGDAIVVGTNCTALSLADALNNLNT